MDVITSATPLTEIVKMAGVSDLQGKQRMNFAMALKNEASGDHDKAAEYLDKAIAS